MPTPADVAVAGVLVCNADWVPVAKISTSVICVAPLSGVANKLFGSIGVLVTLGCCEYGWLHEDVMIATSIRMDATIAPRFIRAIVFSSISNKSFNDGSTSRLARQVMGWEIRGILARAFKFQ